MNSNIGPDAIFGAWFASSRGETALRPAGPLGGLCARSAETGLPILDHAAWGETATIGSLRVVCDARIDYPEHLALTVGVRPCAGENCAALLARCWVKIGPGVLNCLEGDFAFAVWDTDRQTLTLARDAVGQRPLHYRKFSQGLAFGSTALPLAMGNPTSPDIDRLATLLSFIVDPAASSFFRQVQRVVPGHILILQTQRQLRQERWWKPRFHPIAIDYADAAKRMRVEVDRAVGAALATDASVVAAELSGGHDSSLVVASAAALLPPDRRIVAITGDGAGEKADLPKGWFDDVDLAAQTAAMLPNVTHLIARAEPECPLEASDRWFSLGRPMLNPFNLAWIEKTFELARRSGAKVMLVGSSGNLSVSFWGSDLLPVLARSGRLLRLFREWRAYKANFRPSWAGLLAMTFGPWIPRALWARLPRGGGRRAELFEERVYLRRESPALRRAVKLAKSQGLSLSDAPGRLFRGEYRALEMMWADPGLLNHWLRARYDIEVRDPLAARRILELSFQLAPDHFYRDGQARRLSRALLQGRVPERVVSESSRGMQGLNWVAGIALGREAMRKEVDYIAENEELNSLFDVKRLRTLVQQWPTDWSDPETSERYRGILTTTISAARWARRARDVGLGSKFR